MILSSELTLPLMLMSGVDGSRFRDYPLSSAPLFPLPRTPTLSVNRFLGSPVSLIGYFDIGSNQLFGLRLARLKFFLCVGGYDDRVSLAHTNCGHSPFLLTPKMIFPQKAVLMSGSEQSLKGLGAADVLCPTLYLRV
jgi:hypothetical protein